MSTAPALVSRSTALLRQDDPESALECAQEALEAVRNDDDGDKATEIAALCACAEAYVATAEATKVNDNAQEALSMAKAAGSKLLEAPALLAVAKAKLLGLKEAKDALGVLREIGATWGETAVLLSLAGDAAKAPGADSAARLQMEAAQRGKDRWQEAYSLLVIALVTMPKAGPVSGAIDDFLALAKQHGVLAGAAYDPLSAVSRLHCCGGSVRDLEDRQSRLEAAKKAGDRQKQAWALLDLASAKLTPNPTAQVPEVEEALNQLDKLGSKEGAAAARLEAARSRLASGRPAEALREAKLAATTFKEHGNMAGESAAQSACALAHLALGQVPEAVSVASTAPRGLAERGLRRACATALLAASRVYCAVGEQDRALQVGLEAAAVLRDVGDSRGEAFALLQEVATSYVARKEVESALKVASAGLRLLRAEEDLPGEVVALKATADLHLSRGDTEPALRLLQEVVGLCRDSGDALDEAEAYTTAARVRVMRSEAEEAVEAAQAGLAAAQAKGSKLAEARALLALARVFKARKDLDAAVQEANKSAAIFKQLGDRSGELSALSLAWSAQTAQGTAGAVQAAGAAKQASRAFQAAGDQQCSAEALLEAVSASRAAGNSEEAAVSATEAVTIFREMGHTKGEVQALWDVVSTEKARGRQDEAVKTAVEVVSLYKRRDDVRGQADATSELAKVYLDCGAPREALSEVGEARLLFQKLRGPQSGEAALLSDIGVRAHMALNDPPKAVAMAEEAVNLCRRLGDRVGEAAALQACAKVCVQKGDNNSALQAARQSVAVLARARLAREEAEAHHMAAKVHLVRMEPREAVASAAQALTLLRRPGDEAARVEVLETASWSHSLGLDPEGAIGAAEEAVALCRRTGGQRRLATALQALAEAQLVKADFAKAVDTAEEALKIVQELGDERLLEARLLEVSSYGRLGRSQEKKKGLLANPKQALQKAKAAAETLCTTKNRRLQAEAKFLLAKAHLQAGNIETALKEVQAAYESYISLRDGQGSGWSALLIASFSLKSTGRYMSAAFSSFTNQEVTCPAEDAAMRAALNGHSTFRRIGDEEGTEAALQTIADIRALKESQAGASLPQDFPRPRPLPPAISASAPTVQVTPYHMLVGARRLPCRTGFTLPQEEITSAVDEPSAVKKFFEPAQQDREETKAAPRSALASLDNWEKRFDRKVWHNVKATMSGLWEYPDMGKPEPNVLMSAEFVNGWLEQLLAPESVADN